MIFQDRRETLKLVSTVVIHEELMRQKKMKIPALDKTLQLEYMNKWKAENDLFLNNVFGLDNGP
jgi:hypothetical protein